jgi:general secretion pathway protein D
MQALANRSNTKILSAPSIIALDNEEAKYKVGTNIPFTKGVLPATTASTTTSLVSNIDRKDLVLELVIKPHISTGDQVLLEIKHESNDLADKDPTLGPSWSTRGFETRAVVRDQQTFVLGGLMQEREVLSTQQVPLLGDIPIIGHLFKYSNKVKKKTNLIIMLTPYIIKDQLELEAIRERKMREHEEYTRSSRSLAEMRYEPRIDYRRKRGLVEEINRVVLQIEGDAAALDALRRPEPMKSGAVQTEP